MTAKRERPVETLTPARPVENLIHLIRGQKVMLDSDLAALYGVQTFRLNEAVKRNLSRFPEDFMFRLSAEESRSLTSQIAMSKKGRGGRRSSPYAFTEPGVAMLSSILNSERAIQMNILIVRAFIRMRELIASNKDIAARVEKLESRQDRTASVIEILVEDIDRIAGEVKRMKALPEPKKRRIGFI
ncbi:MAG: ORF6N domain-containing protein, partial [Bryobacterales bacterium]|nr:ORF6N domain-containing protein [Bryobacterales bacterium]